MTAPTAPTVTATTPADAATGVGTDTAVSATFDRALDPASVTGQSVVLKDAAGTAVSATRRLRRGHDHGPPDAHGRCWPRARPTRPS